jgi:putative copper resistance protein D
MAMGLLYTRARALPAVGYSGAVVPLALVLLRALGLLGQSLVLGGAAFGLAALRAGPSADPDLAALARRSLALARGGAALLLAAQLAWLALIVASVADAPGWSLLAFLATPLALASGFRLLAALAALAAGTARAPLARGPWLALLAAGLVAAASAAGTSHAAGRLEDRGWLLAVDAIHQAAIALWAGGLAHLAAFTLARGDRPAPTRVLHGFSRVAQSAVVGLVLSGVALATAYLGDLGALIGTAYGGMLLAKLALVAALLALGALNFRGVRRLPPDRAVAPLRLRRLVEVEAGLGVTLLFVAASLGAAPPGVDVIADRATAREVVERFTPRWPSLATPSLAELAVAADVDDPLAPRTAADQAWSEYNHHIAGLFVLVIGVLATLHRLAGLAWARHWPLVFLGLSGFLLLRSDPNAWPLSETQTFLGSLLDPEVLQHRVLALLPAALGLIEWLMQERRLVAPGWARALPLLFAVGGGLLLAHAHPLVRMKEAYLMEVTHLPLGLLGVLIGWTRWLELRLAAPDRRVAARIWPPAVALVGLLLVFYREG